MPFRRLVAGYGKDNIGDMTRDELHDLMQLIPTMLNMGSGTPEALEQYRKAIRVFIDKHIKPLEDAELNAICDERKDMPSVAVEMEDL